MAQYKASIEEAFAIVTGRPLDSIPAPRVLSTLEEERAARLEQIAQMRRGDRERVAEHYADNF
jgi:hypothetical protein